MLNASSKVLFVTPSQLKNNVMEIDNAERDGLSIVIIPDTVAKKISDIEDIHGDPIKDLEEYRDEYNESFEFKFINISELSKLEKKIFKKTKNILNLIGGKPDMVKEILISKTMRRDDYGMETVGLWIPDENRIVIKREQFKSLELYAGTLLHEIAHVISGAEDVSREFELELTYIIGNIASKLI